MNDQIDVSGKGVLTLKCHRPRSLSRNHLVKAPCRRDFRPHRLLLPDPIFGFLCLLNRCLHYQRHFNGEKQ
ncbi:mCG9615, isoform CRA_d [Mus musculus]|nr:mCG9615, isoform CRA_d [Mus musculus]